MTPDRQATLEQVAREWFKDNGFIFGDGADPNKFITSLTHLLASQRAAVLEEVRMRCEEQRQKILANKNDPSWTEHIAEIQIWCEQQAQEQRP